jgi:predicted ArsR family transcriptional regulator
MLKMSGMSSPENKSWRFLSNHTQVLLCISRDPDARLRDIAQKVEITERAAHRILTDLIDSGHVERVRIGRRNHYRVNTSAKMRHPAQDGQQVGTLLELLGIPYDEPNAVQADGR